MPSVNALVQVSALCTLLLEELEKIGDELVSEASLAELREVCERARNMLAARAQEPGVS